MRTPVTMVAIAALAMALSVFATAQWAKQAGVDVRVEDLLKQMTLEEKVGQMTQVTIDVVSKDADGKAEPYGIDQAKLEKAILQYHVGSILNVVDYAYSVDQWYEIISAIQDVATKKARLHIPVLYGIDAIHGATYTMGATLFPQAITMAASWNPELLRQEGEITAAEARASGIPWNFYPVLDMGRQPLWPRFWETLGEDVHLATTMGVEYIKGLQGDDFGAKNKMASCLKHYVGYGFPFTGKDRTPAFIDERTMREVFLPAFEAAVKAGAPTVMVNSGEVNGIPGHANYHLLTEVLKGEWKFQGFVVSDWEDIKRLYSREHVAESPKEAVRMAVMAGIDMSMVPLDFSFYDLLLELAKEGKVPISRIDDAVRRILRVKFMTGIFENAYPEKSLKASVGSKESTEANFQSALEAITLLKNDKGVLPLKKDARILVTGPTANLLSVLNGGWTITWQGDAEDHYPKDKLTLLAAITGKAGKNAVTYVPGTSFNAVIDVPAAVAAAEKSDVIVACLGEKTYCETPGNIDDLTLDEAQLKLVEELAKTKKPIVLVLTEGRPRIIRRIAGLCDGIMMTYLPGMEGGKAAAAILFGDANPCGKLPFSYPRYPNSLVLYDHKLLEAFDGNTYNPEFKFGYGLSYTTFACSDLALSAKSMPQGGSLTVTVVVKNTGARAGKEVVQMYVSDLVRSVSAPNKQLKKFAKVALKPGESRTISFALTADDLSFIGLDNKRIVEPGAFRVSVADMNREFDLK